MSQTQYEFESYRIFSIDNMHRSCIFLCEKMIKNKYFIHFLQTMFANNSNSKTQILIESDSNKN